MPATIHFGGAAYLVPYLLGVGRGLQHHAGSPAEAATRWRYSGSSAGAAVAAFLATGRDLREVEEHALQWTRTQPRWISPLDTFPAVDFGLRLVTALPRPGTLQVVLGHAALKRRFPFVHVRTSVQEHFASVEDLRAALRASAFIPSLSKPVLRQDGRWYLDSAVASFLDRREAPRGLRVGVVPWGYHVALPASPLRPLHAALLRPVDHAVRLSARGYQDMLEFLAARGRW